MHFDLVDLRLFVWAADEGSLTRAAARQHLSLAAASTRIKSLETQSGQALLYREARGVRLTPPGEAFLHHARGVLRQVDQLRSDLQEYSGGLRGHVRVFANTTAVTDFLPEILPDFLSRNPGVNVDLQEKPNAEIARGVLDGRVAEAAGGVFRVADDQDALMKTELFNCKGPDFVMAPLFESALVDYLCALQVIKKTSLVADDLVFRSDWEGAFRWIHPSEQRLGGGAEHYGRIANRGKKVDRVVEDVNGLDRERLNLIED